MFSEEAVKKLIPRKHKRGLILLQEKGVFLDYDGCNEIALKGVESLERKEEESRKNTLEKKQKRE